MGTHPIFESDFDCLTEWLEDSRRFGPSKRTPRDRPSSRKRKEPTKKLLPALLSNSTASCARHRWAAQRRTRCTLSPNTRNCRFQKISNSYKPKENANLPLFDSRI